MKIVRSRSEDAETLTGVAFAAKRHWRYPEHWIQQWESALTVVPEFERDHPTFMAMVGEKVVGFCAVGIHFAEASLEHLWVLPEKMGNGTGRALFTQAERAARDLGAKCLRIESDPHAEGFYLRMGARLCGRKPAPMDGRARDLVVFEKFL